MIDAVNEQPVQDIGAGSPAVRAAVPVSRGRRWVFVATVSVVLLVILGVGAWGGYREARKQRSELKVLRETVEAAAAPGELVVVDDRLLGWALGRGSGGLLKPNLLVLGADAAPSTLLEHLGPSRREMVLVARPDDRLVKALDAAGFSVAQEVGWVQWDPGGTGRGLLGRSGARIFFVVAPKTGTGEHGEGAVSSSEAR